MASFFSETSTTPYLLPVRSKCGYTFIETVYPEWPELEEIMKVHNVKAPLSLFPPELHLEILFLHACNHVNVPATIGTVYNIPWAIAANQNVKHDCLITTRAVVPFLIKKMDTANISYLNTILLISSEIEQTIQLEGIPDSTAIQYIRHPLQK